MNDFLWLRDRSAQRKGKRAAAGGGGYRCELHGDLKRGLDLLAKTDRRTTSQYVEILLLDHVRALLKNAFEDDGALTSKDPNEALILRTDKRR